MPAIGKNAVYPRRQTGGPVQTLPGNLELCGADIMPPSEASSRYAASQTRTASTGILD